VGGRLLNKHILQLKGLGERGLAASLLVCEGGVSETERAAYRYPHDDGLGFCLARLQAKAKPSQALFRPSQAGPN
jgi:hypothetical protein